MLIRPFVIAAMLVLLSACAVTPPFSDDLLHSVNRSLQPEQAVKDNAQEIGRAHV